MIPFNSRHSKQEVDRNAHAQPTRVRLNTTAIGSGEATETVYFGRAFPEPPFFTYSISRDDVNATEFPVLQSTPHPEHVWKLATRADGPGFVSGGNNWLSDGDFKTQGLVHEFTGKNDRIPFYNEGFVNGRSSGTIGHAITVLSTWYQQWPWQTGWSPYHDKLFGEIRGHQGYKDFPSKDFGNTVDWPYSPRTLAATNFWVQEGHDWFDHAGNNKFQWGRGHFWPYHERENKPHIASNDVEWVEPDHIGPFGQPDAWEASIVWIGPWYYYYPAQLTADAPPGQSTAGLMNPVTEGYNGGFDWDLSYLMFDHGDRITIRVWHKSINPDGAMLNPINQLNVFILCPGEAGNSFFIEEEIYPDATWGYTDITWTVSDETYDYNHTIIEGIYINCWDYGGDNWVIMGGFDVLVDHAVEYTGSTWGLGGDTSEYYASTLIDSSGKTRWLQPFDPFRAKQYGYFAYSSYGNDGPTGRIFGGLENVWLDNGFPVGDMNFSPKTSRDYGYWANYSPNSVGYRFAFDVESTNECSVEVEFAYVSHMPGYTRWGSTPDTYDGYVADRQPMTQTAQAGRSRKEFDYVIPSYFYPNKPPTDSELAYKYDPYDYDNGSSLYSMQISMRVRVIGPEGTVVKLTNAYFGELIVPSLPNLTTVGVSEWIRDDRGMYIGAELWFANGGEGA